MCRVPRPSPRQRRIGRAATPFAGQGRRQTPSRRRRIWPTPAENSPIHRGVVRRTPARRRPRPASAPYRTRPTPVCGRPCRSSSANSRAGRVYRWSRSAADKKTQTFIGSVDDSQDTRRRVEGFDCPRSGGVDVNPWRRGNFAFVVGARSVERAVAEHDAAHREDGLFKVGNGIGTRPGIGCPRDALGHDPSLTQTLDRVDEVACALLANPSVEQLGLRDVLERVGQVRQFMQNHVRRERLDGHDQAGAVENVANDRLGTE